MSLASEKNDFDFPAYLSVALGLFIAAFFIVDSAKSINSFYYIFFCAPVIVFFLKKGPGQLGSIKQNVPTLVLGLHFLAVLFTELDSLNDSFSHLKTCLYLTTLWLGLEIASRNALAIARLWHYLAYCSAFVGLYAIAEWFQAYASSSQFIRVHLYAAASNPVHASFLILTGWLGYWFRYGFPTAMQRGKAWFLATLIMVIAFALGICIVFQSRSGLVGSSAALLAWLISGKHRRTIAVALVLTIAAIWISGFYEPLLQRGSSYRFEIWADALHHWASECPILTGCPDNESYLFAGKFEHPHSAFLSILVDTGLVGIVSFSSFALLYFFYGLKNNSAWFQVSLIGWMGLMTTSNGLITSPRPLWVYFWIPTILALVELKRPDTTDSERVNR